MASMPKSRSSRSARIEIIGSQSLTRADLGKVAQRIEYWRNRVAALEKLEKGKGRSRIYKIIPTDSKGGRRM